jgi:uncharacterized membrane protein YkoI
MSRDHKFAAVVALLAVGMALPAAASPPRKDGSYDGQKLAPQAKVTLDQARAIALKVRPGTVSSQELEKEKGGSGLRYSFDIKSGKKTYEVGIDAASGKVLENGSESATAEAKEKD